MNRWKEHGVPLGTSCGHKITQTGTMNRWKEHGVPLGTLCGHKITQTGTVNRWKDHDVPLGTSCGHKITQTGTMNRWKEHGASGNIVRPGKPTERKEAGMYIIEHVERTQCGLLRFPPVVEILGQLTKAFESVALFNCSKQVSPRSVPLQACYN